MYPITGITGSSITDIPFSEKKHPITSTHSTISSQPVEGMHQGSVKRLSVVDRFKLGQKNDQDLLPAFSFKPPLSILNEVATFIKGAKTSLLILGESIHIPLEEIAGEYESFYINLAKVDDPEKAIEETLHRYEINSPEEIYDFRKNHKFLFVFYNSHNKCCGFPPNFSYKNEIFHLWQGKLISFCAPFNLPGSSRSFDSCFMHIEPGRSHTTTFARLENPEHSDEEIQAALNENLTPNALQFVQQMKVMVPGFWKLLKTPSLLQALIHILPPTFEEMSPKKFYDAWMHEWFTFREKETGINGLETNCIDFLTRFAKTMDAERLTEVQYVASQFIKKTWDPFLKSNNETIDFLRNSPLYKIDNRYGFLPSLQHYFATGNVQTIPSEKVDVYYV